MNASRLRVSHLVSGDAWGGLEAMVLDLLSSDSYRARTEATLILLNDGRLAARARAEGLHVVIIPECEMSFRSLLRELQQVFNDLKPDIVHSHRYKEILLGALLSRARGARLVVTIHGYEPPPRFIGRWRTSLTNTVCIAAAILRGCQVVVVADHLRKSFMIPRSRCVTINNGIRIPGSATLGFARTPRDYSKAPVIGWVGRMVPVKGLSTLLRAVAEMVCSPPPVLLLAGDGPERAGLERLAKSLNIAERVRFLGFVENTWPIYGQMDVFALPSRHEGIPMALLEALGVGLPVVASSVGGIPSVIANDRVGVLVESGTPSAWATALTALLRDPGRMDAIGNRAHSHILAHFSVEAMAARYLSVYELTNKR